MLTPNSPRCRKSPLAPFKVQRREPGLHDIQIEILYAGICHSDLHQARDDWGRSSYPMVPGHEIIGRVVKVGASVKKLKAGDIAGVGCMVDSCRECSACQADLEQMCEKGGATWTYNGKGTGGRPSRWRTHIWRLFRTDRGRGTLLVVKVPESLDLKAAAPLLCAGITTYSPLRHWNVGKGQKVGVIGLGGLGHMGIKFAKAFGAHVVMITTSPEKGKDATRLGADRSAEVVTRWKRRWRRMPTALISCSTPFRSVMTLTNPYMRLLKRDSTMVMVGVLTPMELSGGSVIAGRKSVAGSGIGGMAETQEMIDFCAKHNIVSDIEMINIQDVNEAYERRVKNDVKYRFVIDIRSLQERGMTSEADILKALEEKPMALYALQQRVDPSNKSTEGLQDQMMRLRTAGKVKFDIKTGKWSKA